MRLTPKWTARIPALGLKGPGWRTLGPGSVSSLLKIALDVAYVVLGLASILLLASLIAAPFLLPADLDVIVSNDAGGRQLPLTRALAVFGLAASLTYFGGFFLILRQLRKIFRTLTLGDPFQPDNVRRLRQIGLILAVLTGGVWIALSVASRVTHGIIDAQGVGDLMTPIFSVMVVFVLAEVFREGARLRREAELTI